MSGNEQTYYNGFNTYAYNDCQYTNDHSSDTVKGITFSMSPGRTYILLNTGPPQTPIKFKIDR